MGYILTIGKFRSKSMFNNLLHSRLALVLCTSLSVVLAGCTSIGPKTVDRDQLDYGRSVGNSWKNQMLTNLVRLRYVDMPVFVDVGQIVSGYSLETQVSAEVGFNNSFTGGDAGSLKGGGKFTDRPTITYMPKTGEAYLRSLLEPVEPRSLLALVLAGYSSEMLFSWAVEAINGLRNYSVLGNKARSADPEFKEYVSLMQELQDASAISFELGNDPETGHDIILVFESKGLGEAVAAKRKRANDLLGLDPEKDRFEVRYAPRSTDDGVLAMQTRSIIQILISMSGFIDVPPEKSSRASGGYNLPPGVARPFRVRSGPDRPEDSFARIKYHDYWYWIEDEDLQSKRVFTLMLFLTTLTNYAGEKQAPVLTIPTN
jgi:hypothetical protein